MKTQVFVRGEDSSAGGGVKQILVDDSFFFPLLSLSLPLPPRLGAERIPL